LQNWEGISASDVSVVWRFEEFLALNVEA